ncbi:hypothetical protein H9L39_10192 [Fusarium oxysporum f. sp. albedinis]|nr:hypothetical protein H9L39_10192 [Fusarium oxysporum f. sp. albedinis]
MSGWIKFLCPGSSGPASYQVNKSTCDRLSGRCPWVEALVELSPMQKMEWVPAERILQSQVPEINKMLVKDVQFAGAWLNHSGSSLATRR